MFEFVVGANGGGGGRGETSADNEDDINAAAADDDDDDDVDAASAAGGGGGDADGDDEECVKSFKDEFSISLVTIFFCILTIAAMSWPKDGSPASLTGTLLR